MFYSVLFETHEQYQSASKQETLAQSYFKDLGLDLIFNPIINSKKKFKLEEFYFKPLNNSKLISYRQNALSDLENSQLRDLMIGFSSSVYEINLKMKDTRKDLSSSNEGYNNFLTFKDYIKSYVESEDFTQLDLAVKRVRDDFSQLEYTMLIDGGNIKIRKYDKQVDYSKKIAATFEKFRQKDSKDYRHKLSQNPQAKHVEVGVLEVLSNLYKKEFKNLSDFCRKFINFNDETINRFSQEIQFYLSWLASIENLKDKGLKFNYPQFTNNANQIDIRDSFDLALSNKIKNNVIRNDFMLQGPEKIAVITGPNQGGKTTYAKMIGQIHYLGSLGLCVPGSSSSLYLFDVIHTHFSAEEDLSTQDGKLKDDLERLHSILSQASKNSLIIINEIFSSTTVEDAIFLGSKMMDRLCKLESPAVIVTFLDELALHSDKVISMMSTVVEDNPTVRTYKVIRKSPDGSAYAIHLAKKHNLTYEEIIRRLEK